MSSDETPNYEGVINLSERRLGTRRPGIDALQGIDGGGGGGMDGIDARLSSLEAKVGSLETGVSDVKSDLRLAIGAGVGAAVLVGAMVIGSYLLLSGQAEANRKEVTELVRFEIGRIVTTAPAQTP